MSSRAKKRGGSANSSGRRRRGRDAQNIRASNNTRRREVSYPNSGAGRQFQGQYRCFSTGCVGRGELDYASDKIILPQDAFKKINGLKLSFPLFFKLRSSSSVEAGGDPRTSDKKHIASSQKVPREDAKSIQSKKAVAAPTNGRQLCGVLEFVAEPKCVYVPQWIMEVLKIKEGDDCHVCSIKPPPQGTFCKIRPHDFRFTDMLAKLGPKYILESCFRSYSVLRENSTIVISQGSIRYWLDIVETRPKKSISITGSTDLEVEFCPAINAAEEKRIQETKSVEELEQDLINKAIALSRQDQNLPMELNPPRRKLDIGGQTTLEEEDTDVKESRSTDSNDIDEQKTIKSLAFTFSNSSNARSRSWLQKGKGWSSGNDDTSLTPQGGGTKSRGSSMIAEGTSDDAKRERETSDRLQGRLQGSTESEASSDTQLCQICRKRIPKANFSMHSLHCARAHKNGLKCKAAGQVQRPGKEGKRTLQQEHALTNKTVAEQKEVTAKCKLCMASFPVDALPSHELSCPESSQICSCGQSVKRKDMEEHLQRHCANRLVSCSFCKLFFPHKDIEQHQAYCGSRTNQCELCSRWIRLRDMELHINTACSYGNPSSNTVRSSSLPANTRKNSRKSSLKMLDSKEIEDELLRAVQDLSMAEARQRGESLPSSSSSSSALLPRCPRCKKTCADGEALQFHMLTSCRKRQTALHQRGEAASSSRHRSKHTKKRGGGRDSKLDAAAAEKTRRPPRSGSKGLRSKHRSMSNPRFYMGIDPIASLSRLRQGQESKRVTSKPSIRRQGTRTKRGSEQQRGGAKSSLFSDSPGAGIVGLPRLDSARVTQGRNGTGRSSGITRGGRGRAVAAASENNPRTKASRSKPKTNRRGVNGRERDAGGDINLSVSGRRPSSAMRKKKKSNRNPGRKGRK